MAQACYNEVMVIDKELKGKKMIDFIAAENGCIELYAGVGNLVVKSADPEVLADAALAVGGFDRNLMTSSSCDFAEEYGFESQAAFDALLDEMFDCATAGTMLKG